MVYPATCAPSVPKPLCSTSDLTMLSLFTWGLLAVIWLGGCLDDPAGVHGICPVLIIDPTCKVVNDDDGTVLPRL